MIGNTRLSSEANDRFATADMGHSLSTENSDEPSCALLASKLDEFRECLPRELDPPRLIRPVLWVATPEGWEVWPFPDLTSDFDALDLLEKIIPQVIVANKARAGLFVMNSFVDSSSNHSSSEVPGLLLAGASDCGYGVSALAPFHVATGTLGEWGVTVDEMDNFDDPLHQGLGKGFRWLAATRGWPKEHGLDHGFSGGRMTIH